LRREFRRDSCAFSTDNFLVLIDCVFGPAIPGSLPVAGITGCTSVGTVARFSTGCVLMGPELMGPEKGFRLDIPDNAPMLFRFERKAGPDPELCIGEIE
jgi:hypothetical protein